MEQFLYINVKLSFHVCIDTTYRDTTYIVLMMFDVAMKR